LPGGCFSRGTSPEFLGNNQLSYSRKEKKTQCTVYAPAYKPGFNVSSYPNVKRAFFELAALRLAEKTGGKVAATAFNWLCHQTSVEQNAQLYIYYTDC